MLVVLLRQGCVALYTICRTLLACTQAAVTDGLLDRGDGPQHQGMGHFQPRGVRLQMIVDPAREQSRFHPAVQVVASHFRAFSFTRCIQRPVDKHA
jgi:hypothetical protein